MEEEQESPQTRMEPQQPARRRVLFLTAVRRRGEEKALTLRIVDAELSGRANDRLTHLRTLQVSLLMHKEKTCVYPPFRHEVAILVHKRMRYLRGITTCAFLALGIVQPRWILCFHSRGLSIVFGRRQISLHILVAVGTCGDLN